MFLLLTLVLVLSVLFGLFYRSVQEKYKFFEIRHVPYVKPTFLVGSSGPLYFKLSTTTEYAVKIYNSFSNEK